MRARSHSSGTSALFPAVLLALILLAPPSLRSQSIDSLRAMVDRVPADTNLVMLLNSIAQKLASRDPAEAYVHARDAAALAEELGWDTGKAEVLNTLGALHTNAGAYEKALTAFQQCLEVCRARGDGSGTARALRNIGVVQRRIGNTGEAFDYTRQSLEAAKRAGDSLSLAKALVNLGNIENQRNNQEKALSYFNLSRPIFHREGDRFGESSVLNGMANAYSLLGRLTEALRMYDQSLKVNRASGNMRSVASILINIGEIHKMRKDWQAAIRTYSEALSEAEGIDAKDLSHIASQSLGEAFAALGDYKRAYSYYVQHAAIKDSLFNEEVIHQINARMRKYEAREREQQIALLKTEAELQNVRIARQELIRNIIIAGFILLSLFAVWVFILARKRKRSNAELRTALENLKRAQEQLIHTEKMATLGRISTGIAHEILNPLNFIINFADLSTNMLEGNTDAPANVEMDAEERQTLQTNLEKITTYGRRAEGIVTSMMQHAEGGSGSMEDTDLNALLRRALTLARGAAKASAAELQYTLDLSFDSGVGVLPLIPREMTRVILNLHQNAVESLLAKSAAADPDFQPAITVSTAQHVGVVEIRFRDNGIGIRNDADSRIFEPFYTTKPTGKSTGLGLSISYDIIVEGHGGTLSVNSVEGEFAEFVITLPSEDR